MTDTTITQTPSISHPAAAGRLHRRKGVAALAAAFAFAAIAAVTALGPSSGAESSEPRPAAVGASGSADAAERAALLELEERIASCRATTVAPDSLERCIGHRGD